VQLSIREQDTQHNIQQERTQPINLNTHAHQEDLYVFENKTRSTTYNKREHNPPTRVSTQISNYATYLHMLQTQVHREDLYI
jgi:hypothetical protein